MPSRRRLVRRLAAACLLAGTFIGIGANWRAIGVAWETRAGHKAHAVGDEEAALKHFLTAERLDPQRAQTLFLLGRTYRRLGNSQETRGRLQRAGECGFPSQRLQREWLLVKAQAGMLAEVEPVLDKLLTNAGEDGQEICSAVVNGYVRNYEFGKAQMILEGWVGDYPNDPEPQIVLGKIFQHFNNFREAEKHFRAALKLCPSYRRADILLAEVLIAQKKFQEALPLLQKPRQGAETADERRLLLAQCLLNLGREGESLRIYAEIVARSPENCVALLGLGKAKVWAGEYQEALAHLNHAFELCPRELEVRYARAQALSFSGDRTQAQAELQDIAIAKAALAKAGEVASELFQHPDDLDARMELGTTLMKYGDRQEGIAWVESVLQYEPEHQAAHRLLADYYKRQGDDDRADRHRQHLTPR